MLRFGADLPGASVGFTDASLDLRNAEHLARLEAKLGVGFARVDQVHGAEVAHAERPGPLEWRGPDGPGADALVTTERGVGLLVRVADCVPVVLLDTDAAVVGAAHAGRAGVARGVVGRTVEAMRALGAGDLTAWVGPHVCGGCYEVPEALRAEVAAREPATFAETTWGTPALDLGAGVAAQLEAAGVQVHAVGGCTLEDDALHSHRRDGAASGRQAGLVWLT